MRYLEDMDFDEVGFPPRHQAGKNDDEIKMKTVENAKLSDARDSFEERVLEKQNKYRTSKVRYPINISSLASKLKQNKVESDIIPEGSDVVIIIGVTGAGKSTFLQAIAGHELVATCDGYDKIKYTLKGDGESGFDIGEKYASETDKVKVYYSKETLCYYVDTPGYEDTRSFEIDIATALGIKRVCLKASRLRIAVFINANKFFVNKGAPLKDTLKHVQGFIGDNVVQHARSFTFFFTHCNNAFPSIGHGILKTPTIHEKEQIMKGGNHRIQELLKKMIEDTDAEHKQDGVEFLEILHTFSDGGYSNIQLFDPIISDIELVRKQIEPRTESSSNKIRSIQDPEKTIKLNLTKDSLEALAETLENKLNDISMKILESAENNYQLAIMEGINKDCESISLLACYVDVKKSEECIGKCLDLIKKTSQDKRELFNSRMAAGKNSNEYEEISIEEARNISGLALFSRHLDEVMNESLNILKENGYKKLKFEEYEVHGDVVTEIVSNIMLMKNEIDSYIAGVNSIYSSMEHVEVLDHPVPDLKKLGILLSNLGNWSQVFVNEIRNFYEKQKERVYKELNELLGYILKTLDGGDKSVYIFDRAVFYKVVLYSIEKSGLDKCFDSKEENELVDYTGKAKEKADEVISKSDSEVRTLITDTIKGVTSASSIIETKPQQSIQGTRDSKNSDTKYNKELLSSVKKLTKSQTFVDSGKYQVFENVDFLDKAFSVTEEEFNNKIKECEREFSSPVESMNSKLLSSNFENLSIFLNSLTLSFKSKGNYSFELRQIQYVLKAHLSARTGEMQSSINKIKRNGLVSDPDKLKTYFESLHPFLWFDAFFENYDYLGNPFIQEKYQKFSEELRDYCKEMYNVSDKRVNELFTENPKEESDILSNCEKLVTSLTCISDILSIRKLGTENAENYMSDCKEKVKIWCKDNAFDSMTDLISEKELNTVHVLLLAEKHLVKIQNLLSVEDDQVQKLIISGKTKVDKSKNLALQIMKEKGSYERKAQVLRVAEKWSSLNTLALTMPSFSSIQSELKTEISALAQKMIDDIKVSDKSQLNEIENEMKVFDSAKELIDMKIDGEATRCQNNVIWFLEKRRTETDESFKELLDSKDYDGIKKALLPLKESDSSRDHFTKCVKLLSINLWAMIEELKTLTESSESISGEIRKGFLMKWNTLFSANESLSEVTKEFVPGNWTILGQLREISENVKRKLDRLISEADNCVENSNIYDTEKLLKGADLQYELLKELYKTFEDNGEISIIHGRLEGLRKNVQNILDGVPALIEKYLSSLSRGHDLKIEERTGEVFGYFQSRAITKRDNSSITDKVLQKLSHLQKCSEESFISPKIKKEYTNSRNQLTEGVEGLVSHLEKEISEKYFSEANKIFKILKVDVEEVGLKIHLDKTFSLAEYIENSDLTRLYPLTDAYNNSIGVSWIIDIADRLDRTKAFEKGSFRNQDYESYKTIARAYFTYLCENVDRNIKERNFLGTCRKSIYIQELLDRMEVHLSEIKTNSQKILLTFNNQLDKIFSDFTTNLLYNKMDDLEKQFYEYHTLMLDVSTIFDEKPTKTEKFLFDVNNICNSYQEKVHSILLKNAVLLMKQFNEQIEKKDYKIAAQEARKLIEFGNFLCSSVVLYQSEVCSVKESHMPELTTFIHLKFSSDKFLSFAKSMAAFRLSLDSDESEIDKYYKKQSLIWHEDKNPYDTKVSTVRMKTINEAKETLHKKEKGKEAFQDYDFKFILDSISKIKDSIRKEARDHLNRDEFAEINLQCENMVDLENLNSCSLISEEKNIIDVSKEQELIYRKVREKSLDYKKEIEKASAEEKFLKLHHYFTALETLENAFKGNSHVVGSNSISAQVLSMLKENLLALENNSVSFSSHGEDNANGKITSFAVQLIKVGRFYEGFLKLKNVAKRIISLSLNNIRKRPWGPFYLFELGRVLQDGEELGISEDDERVGKIIVKDFSQFKAYKDAIFGARVKLTADVTESLKNTETFILNKSNKLEKDKIDSSDLKTAHKSYQESFEKYFSDFISGDLTGLAGLIHEQVENSGSLNLDHTKKEIRSVIPKILGGIFAAFSILKSGDTFRDMRSVQTKSTLKLDPMEQVFKPHNIQILSILCLLGYGHHKKSITNHIMQVRTGEGKSVILGGLSILLAMFGYKVRCVCYSYHLSQRDFELFEDVFRLFKVEDHIVYSKISEMSEESVLEKGDIRSLTVDLLKGNPLEARKKKSLGRKSLEYLVRSMSKKGSNTKEVLSNEPRKRYMNKNVTSYPDTKETKLNGKTVLLVDEVDVFFGSDFYGNTHNQVASLEDELIEAILKKIWKSRTSVTLSEVQSWSEFKKFSEKYKEWSFMIDREVSKMVSGVKKFNDPPYVIDRIGKRIGYIEKDSVEYKTVYGYRTAFAYLNEYGKTISGDLANRNLNQSLCLQVRCGQFSYVNISPDLILGVSGTLEDISDEERKIIKEFNIDRYSSLPSVYGKKNLKFDLSNTGLKVETDIDTYFRSIAQRVTDEINDGGAALVFFENEKRLEEFKKSRYYSTFKYGKVLDSKMDSETRNFHINKTATSTQVTWSTAAFGRGTDFFCMDRKLEKNGGLHVIQTFLSVEKSEETQIKGRTARQGQNGSYSMILLKSDLISNFNINSEATEKIMGEDLYNYLDKERRKKQNEKILESKNDVSKSSEKDKLSRKYLNYLVEGNRSAAKKHFKAMYDAC